MNKKYNRSWWKNTTPKREVKLFRLLKQRSRSFSDLLNALGWGSQTLTFYLRTLEKKGYIARKKLGRNVIYTLIESNPYVAKMLKLSAVHSHDVRVYSRVELDKLDEEALISAWLNSVRYVLMNVMRDYVLLGKKRKSEDNELITRILQVDIEDLVDIVGVYGQVLTKRVQAGTIRPSRIQEIQDSIRKDVRKRFLQHNTL